MRGSYLIRFIDRIIGIPLLFFLGIFRRERAPLENSPKRIGVLVSAAIGDTVLFMSVVSDLKKKFPDASVTAFVGESNRAMLEHYSGVKTVALRILNPLISSFRIWNEGKFDLWIDSGQWQRISALYTLFARANWKIGFRTPGQGRHFIFDAAVSHMRSVHELENFRNLVRAMGVYDFTDPVLPRRFPTEEGRVVIHAFAGGSKPYLKEWPNTYWIEVINTLLKKGKHIYLTGGKTDFDKAEAIIRLSAKPIAIHNLAGKLSLNETIDELSKAEMVVSVNTGIMHIAAALGVRTIGLHGPTSVVRWGPIGKEVTGIQSPRSCSPCLNLGFDYGCPKNDCMKDLKPSKVLEIIG